MEFKQTVKQGEKKRLFLKHSFTLMQRKNIAIFINSQRKSRGKERIFIRSAVTIKWTNLNMFQSENRKNSLYSCVVRAPRTR